MRYIYILRCHTFYKIGIASDVKQRICQLQIGNPYKIELVECFEIDAQYVAKIEKDLHRVLRNKNVSGEWFRLGDEVLEVIKDYCRAAQKAFREIRLRRLARA
jgi:hypothetical protein